MCGLVGLISKRSGGFYGTDADMFEDMLVMDQVRGMDGTGSFGVYQNKQAHLFKCGTNASVATNLAEWPKYRAKIVSSMYAVFGHNRKATIGQVGSRTSHPFHEENIILMHNGTLTNHRQLDSNAEVDSQAFARVLNKEEPLAALKRTYGAYAFIWYDIRTKLVNIVRNNERPLVMAENDDLVMFASEPWMITSAAFRRNVKLTDMREVPTNLLLQFKSGTSCEKTRVPERTYTTGYQNGYTGYNGPVVSRGPAWNPHDTDGEMLDFEFHSGQACNTTDCSGTEITANDEATGFAKMAAEDLCKGQEIAFIVSKIEAQPGSRGGAEEIRCTGFVPYLAEKVDVSGVVEYASSLVEANSWAETDDKKRKWYYGEVTAKGWTQNGGAWAKVQGIYGAQMVEVLNGTKIPGQMWKHISTKCRCNKCEKNIHDVDRQFTSVNLHKNGLVEKIVCADCIEESLTGNRKNAFAQSRLDALSNGEQVVKVTKSVLH